MKPRAEYEWSEVPYPVSLPGTVTPGATTPQPMAVLWVPDIDARHQWREYAISKPGATPSPVGFRKPGAR